MEIPIPIDVLSDLRVLAQQAQQAQAMFTQSANLVAKTLGVGKDTKVNLNLQRGVFIVSEPETALPETDTVQDGIRQGEIPEEKSVLKKI